MSGGIVRPAVNVNQEMKGQIEPNYGLTPSIQCPMPGVNWDDPGNLFTTNSYYTNGANLGRLKSIVRPDGTLQAFDYSSDATGFFLTNIVSV